MVTEEEESPNDRNDRGLIPCPFYALTSLLTPHPAIRKATAWYNTHISLTRPPVRGQPRSLPTVVLLTDDAANRQKAESEGLQCMSGKRFVFVLAHACSRPLAVRRYVEGLPEAKKIQLLDLLAAPGSDDLEPTKAASARQALYPEVSSLSAVLALTETITPISTCPCPHCWLESRPDSYTRATSTQISITISRYERLIDMSMQIQ